MARNQVARLRGGKKCFAGRVVNVGGGLHPIKGVVNTEFIPTIKNTLSFKPLPDGTYFLNLEFADRSVTGAGAVILSHVIEHIAPAKTLCALENCFAILAPGGFIRVSVPDLAKYVTADEIPKTQQFGIRFVAVNQLIYCHGHKAMFDEELLSALMAHVGFVGMATYRFQEGPLGKYDTMASCDESIYVVAQKPELS